MPADGRNLTRHILDYAVDLAAKTRARALLVYEDVFPSPEALKEFLALSAQVKVVLVAREAKAYAACQAYGADVILAPAVRLSRMGQVKVAILLGLARGLFQPGDDLVCLTGASGSGLVDTITATTVGREFEMVAATGLADLREVVSPEVFERVLELAIRLGVEGREGKPVGTIFVVGDTENVLQHSQQMVLNPFRGYEASERNILDDRLTETIKEFAAIDGAFVIQGDGLVVTAGAYLHPPVAGDRLPSGLGARHNSAAAITVPTKAVTVVVSASTGHVSVFWGGKRLIEIEQPQAVGFGLAARSHNEDL